MVWGGGKFPRISLCLYSVTKQLQYLIGALKKRGAITKKRIETEICRHWAENLYEANSWTSVPTAWSPRVRQLENRRTWRKESKNKIIGLEPSTIYIQMSLSSPLSSTSQCRDLQRKQASFKGLSTNQIPRSSYYNVKDTQRSQHSCKSSPWPTFKWELVKTQQYMSYNRVLYSILILTLWKDQSGQLPSCLPNSMQKYFSYPTLLWNPAIKQMSKNDLQFS